jgi:phosphatidylinositol kinase/protein kinase (PI-3  family)
MRTPEHQWNCNSYPKTTISTCIPSSINKPNLDNIEKTSKLEYVYKTIPSKILYPWNCQSSQDKEDDNLVLNLTISDKQLVYE